jgi:RHS repeat-associated protein
MLYPQDVSGTRKVLLPHYNRAGALESVKLDGTIYVEYIAYNTRGQRMLTALGNGIMIRQNYDPKTFRMLRMRTEQYTKPTAFTYHPTGQPLQDFAYAYDLVGNMLAMHDRTPESGIPNTPPGTDALDRTFIYEPIYRLFSATGRECDVHPVLPWDDTPRCTDLTSTRGYTEQYQYDPVGNMVKLQHQAKGSFTRVFTLAPQSNRLATMAVGTTVYDYAYDPNGNLVQETTSRHFEWDHSDRMRVYRTQVGNTEPSIHGHYLYDANGQRVKKLVRNQGGQFEVTVYINGVFEYHRLVRGGTAQENNTLHVMDHEKRIALIRAGNPFPDDTTPAVKYHLSDHLGSTNVVVDDTGALVNREEYTPYGETSFGSFARKRYRFTGKERDEESGLYYHGARYYAPWLERWTTADPLYLKFANQANAHSLDSPLSSNPGASVLAERNQNKSNDSNTRFQSLYSYAEDNPVRFFDSTGLQDEAATESNPVETGLEGAQAKNNNICLPGDMLEYDDPSFVPSSSSSTTSGFDKPVEWFSLNLMKFMLPADWGGAFDAGLKAISDRDMEELMRYGPPYGFYGEPFWKFKAMSEWRSHFIGASGFIVTASAEGGVVGAGGGGQVTAGAGIGPVGAGGFISRGGFLGGPAVDATVKQGYPGYSHAPDDPKLVFGASEGIGIGAFTSNAISFTELRDIPLSFTLNLGPISIQYGSNGQTYIFSVAVTYGGGYSTSLYPTTTSTTK